MSDLSGRTVAQLKEELQQKGVDVKGLKLKKDYIEKLQQVLDAGSGATTVDEAAREAQQEQAVAPSSNDEQGKHVSSTEHAEAIQDPETAITPAPAADVQHDEIEPDSVTDAKEDSSIAITKEDKNEQILGDADGDLAEEMEAAAEAGRAERIEEEGGAHTASEMAIAEETKEEGNVAVEAAESQPPQVVAQQDESNDATMPEVVDDAMEQEPAHAEKRKREGDDGENDGKRVRLSPAPERDLESDTITRSPLTATSPVRPTKEEDTTHPLPDKLSHVSHPATRALYISNLRRPLLLPDLKAWLIEQGTSEGVQEDDVLDAEALTGGVWLDGVKSHCYCIFKTIEIAIAAGTKIQDQVFPADHGVALTVEFIPEGTVPSLVAQEKAAWQNGRNKLVLEITRGQGGSDYSFDLVPPKGKDGIRSSGGLGDLRPPRATPASRPPELGGAPGFNSAPGRPEFRPPPSSNGWGARASRDEIPGLQRTRTQPSLMYRESLKYAQATPRFERPPRDSGAFGSQPRHNGPQGTWSRSNDRGWGRPTAGGW